MKSLIKKAYKWCIFKVAFPFWYFLGSRRKVEPDKIIFVEVREKTLSHDFQLLYNSLISKHPEIFYLKNMEPGKAAYLKRCFSLIREISNASIIFVSDSTNVLGAFSMRKDTALVQLWHACGAFKKWGFSSAQAGFGDSYEEMKRYPYHRNYTLVPVSATGCIPAYEEAFGLEGTGKVQALGVSRTDYFFQEEFLKARREEWAEYLRMQNREEGKKVLLYAPTFRGEAGNAKAPDALDIKALHEGLGDGYLLLVKNHPFVKEKLRIPKGEEGFVLDASALSIETLLVNADLCITDYSSLVFEYALFERPMIFFAYDLEEYYDNRGFYYPYEEFVPGPICRDTKGLISAIQQAEQESTSERTKGFKERFMASCDGQATKRILDQIVK